MRQAKQNENSKILEVLTLDNLSINLTNTQYTAKLVFDLKQKKLCLLKKVVICTTKIEVNIGILFGNN